MHINDEVIDPSNGRIDPHKIDLMGRMGRSYYVRASGDAVHSIYQSVTQISIGYDSLPASIKNSTVLTANDLAVLSGITALPNKELINKMHNEYSELNDQRSIDLVIKALIKNNRKEEGLALAMGL